MDLIKAVRVRPENTKIYERLGGLGDYKLMLFKETKKKYKVGWFPVKGGEPSGVLTTTEYKKSGIYENLTEEDFLIEGLNLLSKMNKRTYEIVQDPWEYQPPLKRIYNSDPYYLNNGAKILIKWFIGDRFNAGDKRTWVAVVPSDIWSGERGEELAVLSYQGNADIRTMNDGLFKTVEIYAPVDELPPFKYEGDDTVLLIDYETNSFVKKPENDPNNSSVYELTYSGKMYDIDILNAIIERWKLEVPNYDLKPCANQYQPCYALEYKSPLVKEDLPDTKEDNVVPVTETTPEVKREKLNIVLPSDLKLKVKQDMPSFKVFIGDVPPNEKPSLDGFDFGDDFDDLSLLDEQYIEEKFSAEEESPASISEVPPSATTTVESSTTSEFSPGTSAPGTIVSLPEKYSHTSSQGFNLLNSQWIGNLIASAKSHIKTPTYDISGTENGNLGCASAVSIIFYRAFGVHMKTGNPVKSNPTSIGNFGSKGTSELSGWFESSPNLYQKIPWQDAQPGDIINTARNFTTNRAGHIGIVIDVKHSDGSWAIVSNSSKGFEGGGGGAVKQNYSVKKWKSVADRNPSKTFAFRYIGPSLANASA